MKKYIAIRIVLAVLTIVAFFVFIFTILQYTDLLRWTRGFSHKEMFDMTIENLKVLSKSVIKDFYWGKTMTGEDAWALVKERLPISIKLNLMAFFIYIILGIILGITSAVFKDTIYDKIVISITMFLGSIPTLVWIMILVIIFGYTYRILPPLWSYTLSFPAYGDYLIYIMPITALCMEPISKITRLVRAELVDTFESDYILLCKAKGMKRRQIIVRHNFKHILVVLLPELSVIFLYALLNSFFIEDVYDIDGVARLFMDGIISGDPVIGILYVQVDVYLITVISMYIITFSTIMILITDLLMGVIDPRIKIYGKKHNM